MELLGGAVGTDGGFYVAGGWQPDVGPRDRLARLDGSTNSWASRAPLPVPVAYDPLGLGGAGQLVVAGGALGCSALTCTVTNTLQLYDSVVDRWTLGPPVPLAGGLEAAASAGLNGKFYLFGGDDGTAVVYTSTWIYDPGAGSWTRGAALPAPRTNTVATAVGSRIYLYGGSTDLLGQASVDTLYGYDPAADAWTTLPASGDPEVAPGLSPYGADQLLVTGGGRVVDEMGTSTAATHLYSIPDHTWQDGPPLLSPRAAHTQGQLPDGRVIVYGGAVFQTGMVLASSEELGLPPATSTSTPTATPTAATATPTTPPPTARSTAPSGATATPSAAPTNTVAGRSPTSTPPLPTRGPGCLFVDVCPGDYWFTPVQYLVAHGAIAGYADGTFRPYVDTTRGQLAKIVVAAVGWPLDLAGGPHFTDVPPAHPFYGYIETAYNHTLISGYTDGTFRPANNVTRGQLCKIVVTAQGWPAVPPPTPHFRDVPVADPFYAVVETAYAHRIINGYADGTFHPSANATRGQIAKIVYGAVTQP